MKSKMFSVILSTTHTDSAMENSALQNVDIPIRLRNKSVMLNTHVVASDIPLLLSRVSIKKADMTLDFKNNNAMIFGKLIQLIVTKSGHCAIHVRRYSPILNNVTKGVKKVTLLACGTNKSKYDIA